MRVGIDLVHTASIDSSLANFGGHFLRRVYTEAEVAQCDRAPTLRSARLAARFAAKEATIKALDLSERGVGWRDIEITRAPSGAPSLALHGGAAEAARGLRSTVSLSHDGEYAMALVIFYVC
jgi:holo-[acyl-carrier protein] synthase